MSHDHEEARASLPAGPFSAWLRGLEGALRGERDAEVACDGCTACCESSQFVHIGPDESATLARIPVDLVFPAPRMPAGHVLMGYDERGRCPMLGPHGCTIYDARPRTCRTYDCRVFPAAGIEPSDPNGAIAQRARQWRFEHPTPLDEIEHRAVRAAAAFVRDRGAEVFDGDPPANPTQVAVVSVEIHRAFLADDPGSDSTRLVDPDPDPAHVRAALRRPDPPDLPGVGA